MPDRKARLCVVGPLLARHPGWVTTQGEILAELLEKKGYPVLATSSVLNRYARLLDTIFYILTHRKLFDILFVQVYSGPSFVVWDAASLVGKILRKKIVLRLDGGAFPEHAARFPGWSRRVLARADVIITPTMYLGRVVEQLGFPVRVIPQVVDLADYHFKLRRKLSPRVFWMRTFQDIYNPEMAVRAFQIVLERYPEAILTMAGQEKGRLPLIRDMVHEAGLEDRVGFPGFLDAAQKAARGDAHDIFINTNHVDNTPVSVIEAGAMGLPIVATAVGGLPDLLTDEETGLLVLDDDHRTMAKAIIRLLETPELAERLSRGGRKLAEQSHWDNVYPLWDELFTGLL